MPRRALPVRGLALLLALLLTSCFEPPVREDVSIRFDEHGGAEVVVTTHFEREESYKENPRAAGRLLEAREAARCGEDPFTRQLESLPGGGGRASVAERLEVTRELDRFSAAASRYTNALADLWAWLDEHPGEERLVVGALFDVDEPKPEGWTRDEREEALVDAVAEAMNGVHEFFLVTDGRGESLDELSRKAFDPFPAPLWVRVPGAVLESTGFVREEDGGFRVPPVSLWGALSGLSGRWVTPDPLAEKLRNEERQRETAPDLDRILAHGRRVVARPSATDVRGALEAALAPAPAYRLRWRAPQG